MAQKPTSTGSLFLNAIAKKQEKIEKKTYKTPREAEEALLSARQLKQKRKEAEERVNIICLQLHFYLYIIIIIRYIKLCYFRMFNVLFYVFTSVLSCIAYSVHSISRCINVYLFCISNRLMKKKHVEGGNVLMPLRYINHFSPFSSLCIIRASICLSTH